MMAGRAFLVLTGACQFGHGVGGFATNFIHSLGALYIYIYLKEHLRVTHKTSYFLLIIPIGRLEATASADGDIRRSSQLDHSKELNLKFLELYWSSFYILFSKTATETKTDLCF